MATKNNSIKRQLPFTLCELPRNVKEVLFMRIVNPNRSSHIIRFFAQTFNTTKASPSAVQETVTFKGELREKNDLFLNDLPTFVVSIFDY